MTLITGMLMLTYFVITGVMYLAFLAWGIRWILQHMPGTSRFFSRTSPQLREKREVFPRFQILEYVLRGLWAILVVWGTTFVIAAYRLHVIERATYLVLIIGIVFPYGFACLVLLHRFTRHAVEQRREAPFRLRHLPVVCGLVLVGSLVLFVFAQEQNPLAPYGVEMEWYDPTDALVRYHIVHFLRHVEGTTLSGPLCEGPHPQLTFADIDQDGIPEIIVSTNDGRELGVIKVVEPYLPEHEAFTVLRGTCHQPHSLPSSFLKVGIF
jgi:hypothetical protein